MKRWTNGLPGATKRLGAMMALRGLSASQPRMRADTHDGPEQIAPLQRPDTLMQLSRFVDLGSPSCTARPGHTCGTPRRFAEVRRFGRDRSEADMPRASGAGRSDENGTQSGHR